MKIPIIKEKLLIIGANSYGKVVADIAVKMNRWNQIEFLDDDETLKTSLGLKIIGKSKDALNYIEDVDIFVAIEDNKIRQTLLCTFQKAGASIPVLIHNSTVIGEQVEIGEGTVVMAGVVINCCTRVGKGCIINTGSHVDHDNMIDDYVHIAPVAGLGGTVKVGRGSCIGIGSVVINNIRITSECKIGAGAVVVRDIAETGTYVGVPAKRICAYASDI